MSLTSASLRLMFKDSNTTMGRVTPGFLVAVIKMYSFIFFSVAIACFLIYIILVNSENKHDANRLCTAFEAVPIGPTDKSN